MNIMKLLFRRKRSGLLKPVLSLSLFFASLLLFHKLKFPEDTTGSYTRHPGSCEGCSGWKKGSKPTLASHNHVTVPSAPGAHSNRSAPFWDVQVLNCSEDAAVRTTDWFRRLDPRFHQFVLHRHCRYFPMLINHPEKCAATVGEVHLLIVVKSIIEQHDRREAVRKTWGREYTAEGKSIKTLFLLGSPSVGKDTKNLQKLIEYEDQIYEDILQWDFMDTFLNLTLKEVNFLKWFDIYCPGVQFIFKGDDDVFVNTNNLLDLIGFKVEEHKETTLFVGHTMYRSFPIRNKQKAPAEPRDALRLQDLRHYHAPGEPHEQRTVLLQEPHSGAQTKRPGAPQDVEPGAQ
ncbi:UDP-GlcNAc:betaGal beta-1,3-N-acetylglucosaminyltransferase 7, like isoform X4 [Hippocampus comes]|uniref:UDP-GlcNAc:betaGal beta-1,3-N-acetylglucosaminyltransferase 7, like isoform X4 n=1 Tax=Hippocampus comes TaxID=109280 RepID=UPI00094E52C4|nr:PREDICTED: UDP-GlcNAc:betaGal beta-1,3-N-acetylglucosaminyltransferase 7-like isoform X4 [Hippocampus comes]